MAPCLVPVRGRFEGFFGCYFVVQQFRRFDASGVINVQPIWFYPAILLRFGLPWLPSVFV